MGHPVYIFTANAKEYFEFLMINYKGFIKENLTNLFLFFFFMSSPSNRGMNIEEG